MSARTLTRPLLFLSRRHDKEFSSEALLLQYSMTSRTGSSVSFQMKRSGLEFDILV